MDKAANEYRETARWKIYLLWLALILLFCSLLLVVAPGRGAAWIQDDGLFLRMSWDAANGFGLDRMLPQSPSYLFHALLIKAGMIEYLHFRYLNYIVILLSSLVFFLGIDRRRFFSLVVPIAACSSLLVSLDSIQNPNSLSLTFFMLGAGCYFFSTDATQRVRHMLLLLSGVLFAIAGFMHAATAVAMIVLIGIVWIIDPATQRSFLLPSFISISLILWGSYISSIGMDVILAAPAGHDSSLHLLVQRIWLILIFYLKALALYLLALYFYRKHGWSKFAEAQVMMSAVVTFFCVISLITYLGGSQRHFPGWLWVSQIPGAVFYLLYFALFRWIGVSCSNARVSFGQPETSFITVIQMKLSTLRLRMHAAINSDTLNRKYIVAVSGFALMPAAVAVGSNTAIIQGMVFFAGPAAGFLFILWEDMDRRMMSKTLSILITIWLVIFGIITFTYNHPTGQPVISANRVKLDVSPLRGILETVRYASAIEQLKKVYQTNECRSKTLLVLEYIPMVYYILQHPAPNDIGVVRPLMYLPVERMLSALKNEHGWCVIDVTGIETQADIEHNHGTDKRATIRALIRAQSDKEFTITSPDPGMIGDAHFYVHGSRKNQD